MACRLDIHMITVGAMVTLAVGGTIATRLRIPSPTPTPTPTVTTIVGDVAGVAGVLDGKSTKSISATALAYTD